MAGSGSYACAQWRGFLPTKAKLMAVTAKCPNTIYSFRQTIYLIRNEPSDIFQSGEVSNLNSSEETFIWYLNMISCHASTNTVTCGLNRVLAWDLTWHCLWWIKPLPSISQLTKSFSNVNHAPFPSCRSSQVHAMVKQSMTTQTRVQLWVTTLETAEKHCIGWCGPLPIEYWMWHFSQLQLMTSKILFPASKTGNC